MFKSKKFSLLLLSLVLVVGILAACSGGSNNENNNTPAPTDNGMSADNNNGTPDEPEIDIEYPDLDGRTITLAAWWDISPDPESITYEEELDRIAQVESNYNVKINFHEPLAWEDMNSTFIQSVLDGKPFADLIRFQYDWALPAALNGQLQKFGDLWDPDYFTVFFPGPQLLDEDYSFTSFDPSDSSGVFFNYEVLNELGLKSPHEYVAEGNWTWETFTELARAATVDIDNDGVNDYWGMSGWANDFAVFAAASNDTSFVYAAEQREGISDPKTVATYEWMRQLHLDDKVWYAENTPFDYLERDTFAKGNSLFMAGWMWMTDTLVDIDKGFVPFPIGPSGTDYVSANDSANKWFIPAGVEDADIVLRIFEDMQDKDPDEEYPGQEYLERRFNRQEDIDAARMLHGPDKMQVQLQRAYQSAGFPIDDLMYQLIVAEQPTATVVEMFKQQAQAAIDTVHSQIDSMN